MMYTITIGFGMRHEVESSLIPNVNPKQFLEKVASYYWNNADFFIPKPVPKVDPLLQEMPGFIVGCNPRSKLSVVRNCARIAKSLDEDVFKKDMRFDKETQSLSVRSFLPQELLEVYGECPREELILLAQAPADVVFEWLINRPILYMRVPLSADHVTIDIWENIHPQVAEAIHRFALAFNPYWDKQIEELKKASTLLKKYH